MKIRFLGTGAAGTVRNWHANMVVENKGRNLLIDAGSDLKHSLYEMKLKVRDIDAVYVSHLHGDHVQGLEHLGFSSYFDPSFKTREKITLYGNGELLRRLWDKCLSGAMESVQGKIMDLNGYFNVQMVRPNDGFEWAGLNCQLVQTVHIMNGYVIVPSYGVMINDPDSCKTVYFTTDSQNCPSQLKDFYAQADLIIQDCETEYASGVHAHFDELITLPKETRAKMVLTHYQDNILLNDQPVPIVNNKMSNISIEWLKKCGDANFLAFAEKGMTIDVSKDGFKIS